MSSLDMSEESWTYDGRVASFKTRPARRASTARGIKATKAIKWPHSFLTPEDLADAGFYYNPSSTQNDNVTCFLCQKSIVGWEKDDDPTAEHLKLSSECGWAVVASIQAKDEDLLQENPMGDRMVGARQATFGDRWPHEGKKGWKCKTKQLVDAGWVFSPTLEFGDLTSCVYCELQLDGWEAADDPLIQHTKRAPDCAFFTLLEQFPAEPQKKKTTKGRKPRASKASRASTQSTTEDVSVNQTYMECTVGEEENVVTTAPAATAITKAGTKGFRTAAAKRNIRGTRASSISPIPSTVDDSTLPVGSFLADTTAQEDDSVLTTASNTTATTQLPPKKSKAAVKNGGRKTKAKKDEPIQILPAPEPEDDDFEVKVPVLSKSTRGQKRSSDEMDASTVSVAEEPPAKRRTTRNTRGSAVASAKATRGKKPVVNEVEKSFVSMLMSASSIKHADRAMFNAGSMEVDEDEIDAELEILAESTPRPAQATKERFEDEAEEQHAIDSEEQRIVEPTSIIKENNSEPIRDEASVETESESQVTFHVEAQDYLTHESQDQFIGSPSLSFQDAQQSMCSSVTTPKATAPSFSAEEQAEFTHRSPPQSLRTSTSRSFCSPNTEMRPPPDIPSTIRAKTTTTTMPLAPTTPRASPSKRNIIHGIHSAEVWTAVNLDTVFGRIFNNKENSTNSTVDDAMNMTNTGLLSEAETSMTVDAWIKHNAASAEKKLKAECDHMILAFEREGRKAMRVLESIQCVD